MFFYWTVEKFKMEFKIQLKHPSDRNFAGRWNFAGRYRACFNDIQNQFEINSTILKADR